MKLRISRSPWTTCVFLEVLRKIPPSGHCDMLCFSGFPLFVCCLSTWHNSTKAINLGILRQKSRMLLNPISTKLVLNGIVQQFFWQGFISGSSFGITPGYTSDPRRKDMHIKFPTFLEWCVQVVNTSSEPFSVRRRCMHSQFSLIFF